MTPKKRYNEVQPAHLGVSDGTGIKQASQDRKDVEKKRKRPKSSRNSSEDWPKSLQDFTTRSFQRAEQELDVDQKKIFQAQIQQLLEMALAQNAIWTTNWSSQKIPILDNVPMLYLEPMAMNPVAGTYSGAFPGMHPAIYPGQNLGLNPGSISVSAPVPAVGGSVGGYSQEVDFNSQAKKRQRAARFESTNKSNSSTPSNEHGKTIVGRSKDLEKNYLRLTTEPNPDNVRPFEILKKSMKHVVKKYQENNNYSYIINQFKSIRQDLTVQHIKGDFTIEVYETNARISLQNNDLGEFNQCQSQLKVLYYQKRKGNGKLKFFGSEVEFLIYRIIYMIMTSNYGEIYKLKFNILTSYNKFHKTPRESKLFQFIESLFQLNQDILNGNYYNFFKIIKFEIDLPLAFQLINNYITNKVRVRALGNISKSYRVISASFLIDQLKFGNLSNLEKFLTDYSLCQFLVKDSSEFDCLNARQTIADIIAGAAFKKVDIKGQI